MSASLQPVRGTHDLLPDALARMHAVVDTARRIARCFGFREAATPIFEFTDVFARTLGETSDVVAKEMYTFPDRGGESLTLRPELTAGLARAFITHGLASAPLPVKWIAWGPVFRYERPQKGRMRQFHQFDAEILGAPEPEADVDAIVMAAEILAELGLRDHVRLELNSLGDGPSRAAYRAALVDYLEPRRAQLSAASQERLARNPLRILDSKDPGDRALVADAPALHTHLTPEARQFFDRVTHGLSAHGVAFTVVPTLVRGLDYYTHTAFEFITDALGAQGTVLAGGRYDHLLQTMGGPDIPGIGWAAGLERLAALREEVQPEAATPESAPPLVLIPRDEAAEPTARALLLRLRRAGMAAECAYTGHAGKRLKHAARRGARWALFVGSAGATADGEALTLRNLTDGTQHALPTTAEDAGLPEVLRGLV